MHYLLDYMMILESHLTRGAWIEIKIRLVKSIKLYTSHLTRGAWIEMLKNGNTRKRLGRRTSHEVRGLK